LVAMQQRSCPAIRSTLHNKGKGKFHHRTSHEVRQGEKRYSSTLRLTSALDRESGQRHPLAALPPGKRTGTHFIGGWVGLLTGLDGCGRSRPTGIQSPDSPAHCELLYRLSYRSPLTLHNADFNNIHCTRVFIDSMASSAICWKFCIQG